MIRRFIFINISPALTPMPPSLITRFLAVDDIAALLELESQQWTSAQAADADTLAQRIAAYPQLCIGTFCTRTGKVLASLFMRPTTADDVRHARCWMECAAIMPVKQTGVASRSGRSLFGISLTSIDAQAASALFAFFWPYALKNGWRDIYLGSPLPGLKRAFENDAKLDVHTYARARRGKLPRDPQLRYYHRKGFKHLVAVKPDYFPHEASLNHGAVLRGKVPLSQWSALWRRLPLTILRRLLESILRFEDWYADSLLASAIPLRALR